MKYSLFLALSVALFFAACKNDPKTAPSPFASLELLDGNWIALDFCARANQYGSVLTAMNIANKPFAYSVRFDKTHPDSAVCFNGVETFALPIKVSKDTIELKGAVQGKSVFMVYNSQSPEKEKTINMFDATSGAVKLDRFVKSKAETTSCEMAFNMALNHQVLPTGFTMGKGEKVFFRTTGEVEGLEKFRKFDVCKAGDCFMAGQDIDVITLYRSKDDYVNYGYRYNKSNDTLRLYNLIEKNPNEKGTAKVGAVVYTLAKMPKVEGSKPGTATAKTAAPAEKKK